MAASPGVRRWCGCNAKASRAYRTFARVFRRSAPVERLTCIGRHPQARRYLIGGKSHHQPRRACGGEKLSTAACVRTSSRYPEHELDCPGDPAVTPRQSRGLTKAPDVSNAEVRCELAAEFVTQPKSRINIGETRADASARIGPPLGHHAIPRFCVRSSRRRPSRCRPRRGRFPRSQQFDPAGARLVDRRNQQHVREPAEPEHGDLASDAATRQKLPLIGPNPAATHDNCRIMLTER